MLRQRRARRRRRRQLRVVHAVQPCARLQGGGLRAGAPLPRGASAGRHTQPGLRDTGGALRQRRLRRARQLHAARPAPGRDAQEEAGHDGDEWGARHPQVGLQRKGRHRERGRRADRRRSARARRVLAQGRCRGLRAAGDADGAEAARDARGAQPAAGALPHAQGPAALRHVAPRCPALSRPSTRLWCALVGRGADVRRRQDALAPLLARVRV
mmetsp:Transcript_35759/g.119541  ORF Transcript_35759/g.119541 Transcript_35759/m.119541 type:complete len:213 (+) Transcript_35759:427-1065(+)